MKSSTDIPVIRLERTELDIAVLEYKDDMTIGINKPHRVSRGKKQLLSAARKHNENISASSAFSSGLSQQSSSSNSKKAQRSPHHDQMMAAALMLNAHADIIDRQWSDPNGVVASNATNSVATPRGSSIRSKRAQKDNKLNK